MYCTSVMTTIWFIKYHLLWPKVKRSESWRGWSAADLLLCLWCEYINNSGTFIPKYTVTTRAIYPPIYHTKEITLYNWPHSSPLIWYVGMIKRVLCNTGVTHIMSMALRKSHTIIHYNWIVMNICFSNKTFLWVFILRLAQFLA